MTKFYLALALCALASNSVWAKPTAAELSIPCASEAGVYAMAKYAEDSGASEDMLDVVSLESLGAGKFDVEIMFQNGSDLEFVYYDVLVGGRCELKSITETARD
ncbi:MAG: hypothetical protein JST16_10445 [Bdellovibrionales bacterium]|nr:hypothetical protein [Bdellovibrionales bacterium]